MNTQQNTDKKEIILTGDRATGPLHLGHYVGSLKQRVALQEIHEQTILVADMQGLTDNAHNPRKSHPTFSMSWLIISPSVLIPPKQPFAFNHNFPLLLN